MKLLPFFETFVAVLSLLIVSLLLFHMLPHAPTEDVWSIFTAIATFGAVVVALYLSQADKIQRKADKLELAQLSAASFVTRVLISKNNIEMAIKDLHMWAGFFEDFDTVSKRLLTDPLWSTEELIPLLPLPNHAAAKLSAAAANIKAIYGLLANAKYSQEAKENPREFYQSMVDSLGEARLQLQTGFDECQRRARFRRLSTKETFVGC